MGSPGGMAFALLLLSALVGTVKGVLGGFLLGVLYNVAAYFTGGVTVAPEIVVAVVRGGNRSGSMSYEDYIRRQVAPGLPGTEEDAGPSPV
jgi:hypothetical protein